MHTDLNFSQYVLDSLCTLSTVCDFMTKSYCEYFSHDDVISDFKHIKRSKLKPTITSIISQYIMINQRLMELYLKCDFFDVCTPSISRLMLAFWIYCSDKMCIYLHLVFTGYTYHTLSVLYLFFLCILINTFLRTCQKFQCL